MAMTIPTSNVTHVRGGPNGEKSYEVKLATVDAAGNGNRVLVAAVSGKKIRVLGGKLFMLADGTVEFLSTTTSLFKWEADVAGGSGGEQVVIDLNGCPWGAFETAAGGALEITTDANVDVDGWIAYIEV